MQKALNETSICTQSLQEQIQHMQRSVMDNEHEKKVLQEKYDNLTSQYNQNKRTLEIQNDKIQGLKQEISDAEVSFTPCVLLLKSMNGGVKNDWSSYVLCEQFCFSYRFRSISGCTLFSYFFCRARD